MTVVSVDPTLDPLFLMSDEQVNSKVTCPTCGKRFLMDETKTPPFCCERCRLIDLGRWIDEEIALPQAPDESPKTIDRDLVE